MKPGLPVTLLISRLPEDQRTLVGLAKFYYHQASRTHPIRQANPHLREVGSHYDLVDYFATNKGRLTITIPEIDADA